MPSLNSHHVRKVLFRLRQSRFIASDRAQSMVEVALLLPLLVFVLIGGADLARAFALQLAVQNGARAGAEAAAIDFAPSTAGARARALNEMSRTPALDPLAATIDVTFTRADGTACLIDPTPADPCWATVRVQYDFRTVTPWPIIPNTAHFDRTTQMRVFKKPV
jgi:Flp pilus assembly protein TadG